MREYVSLTVSSCIRSYGYFEGDPWYNSKIVEIKLKIAEIKEQEN